MKHLKCLMALVVLSLLVVPAAMADTTETTEADVAVEAVTAEAVETETVEAPEAPALDLEIQEPVLMSAPADCVYRCPGLPLCPNYPDHSVQCINGCCIYSPL